MKQFISLILVITLFNCSNSNSDKNFIVNGKITGLKKGTIYLEKIDSLKLIVVDSIHLDNGTETFQFAKNIKEPEMFILSVNKSRTKQLYFFGEHGIINIQTNIDAFYANAKISGSKLQELLENYQDYIKRFQDENLDLIKNKFESQKHNDFAAVEEIENKRLRNLKRMYLFSANYAIINKDNEIGPYIAYAKMDQAAPQLKQKIYNELSESMKKSKYGILLKSTLETK
ncbi:DUF4369 domain-containing protein [Wenyingzhuangia sp. 2_MG-2023]|uniref:DUF4369 domain-containing protein n=1 Tax=Wenyingzhuangia sp. 2_MG-2023 TaxID=3062639 RepID=UPI0026E26ABA|nr:DUF4369 domain-containing protein [Wenyingzhuangia sp. 2_MG-2023]MDO6737915.1 DUF4369 domain-containing protein [Wenyingzhuangia sp. 2_MG-2023]